MRARCPLCSAEQELPGGISGSRGRVLRCSRCTTRWVATPYDGLLPIDPNRDIADAEVIDDGQTAPNRPRLPVPARPRIPVAVAVASGPRLLDGRAMVFGGILVAAILAAFLWSPLVAALPDTNRLTVESGMLEFQKVKSETVASGGGARTLIVEGELVNRSTVEVALPAIEITLRSESGQPVTSWLVRLAAEGLAAGRTIGFRSAVASPPPDAVEVTLNLSNRDGRLGFE